MRKDTKKVESHRTETVAYYHGSTFRENAFWASDRRWTLDYAFRPVSDKAPVVKGYGLEIETESRGLADQTTFANVWHGYIAAALPADLFRLENDGSLGGGGWTDYRERGYR